MRKRKVGVGDRDSPFATTLGIVWRTYAALSSLCEIVAIGGNAMQDRSTCHPMMVKQHKRYASLTDFVTTLLHHMTHCNDS